MPDSGDDAAMASVNAAIEILRLAMLHGRGRRRGGGRGGSGGAVEAESALAQAYDDMGGRRVSPDFESGDPGNVVFGVKTVEWDPSCEIVADNLEELGVPFSKTIEGETAWFEISGENAFAARALLDGLCEHVRAFDYDRILNYEGLVDPDAPAPAARAAAGPAAPVPAPAPIAGKAESVRVEIREPASDPGCGLVAKELDARGVPYARSVAGGVAAFEVPAASAAAAKAAIDSVQKSIYEYEHASISGYDGLAAAAARKTANEASAVLPQRRALGRRRGGGGLEGGVLDPEGSGARPCGACRPRHSALRPDRPGNRGRGDIHRAKRARRQGLPHPARHPGDAGHARKARGPRPGRAGACRLGAPSRRS